MAAHLREARSFVVSSHNPSNGMTEVHVIQGAPGLPEAPVDGDAPCTAAAAWEESPQAACCVPTDHIPRRGRWAEHEVCKHSDAFFP